MISRPWNGRPHWAELSTVTNKSGRENPAAEKNIHFPTYHLWCQNQTNVQIQQISPPVPFARQWNHNVRSSILIMIVTYLQTGANGSSRSRLSHSERAVNWTCGPAHQWLCSGGCWRRRRRSQTWKQAKLWARREFHHKLKWNLSLEYYINNLHYFKLNLQTLK